MNRMLKSLPHQRGALFLAGALLLAAPCMAQTDAPTPDASGQTQGPPPGPGGPRHGGPEHRAEMLQHELNLTTDQYTQVKALLEVERREMDALHANSSLSREAVHSQMMTLHGSTDAKIRALLTSEQAAKYDAMEARMRARMEERRQEGSAPPPPPPDGAPQP